MNPIGAVNVWILCNEDAGRGLSGEDLQKLVEQAGHTVVGVAKRYDERTPLPAATIDLIVAAGGDGTVATAAAIVSKSSAALGILPLGTANNIATSLGVTRPIPELIASWASARRVPFDLGRAHAGSREWCVVEGVGGGLMPAGIARAQAELRQNDDVSPAAEVATALRTFRDALAELQPRRWTLTLDGDRIAEDLLLVEVLNIRSIGPNLVFGPDATPSDGWLDVVMAQERHRQDLSTYLERRAEGCETRLALPTRRVREGTLAGCADLHIDDERVHTCTVGELTIRVEPAAVTVLI
ncbi:MAG TPA: diacylglycerol kinase family protein [Vicinamibacterales bacterium]|nr:diacylglycerol kinase family protein [Vicinamibacterales bacterium]